MSSKVKALAADVVVFRAFARRITMRAHWAFSGDGCLVSQVDEADFGGNATLTPVPLLSLEESRAKIIEELWIENQRLKKFVASLGYEIAAAVDE
jgi:hypothetical protein